MATDSVKISEEYGKIVEDIWAKNTDEHSQHVMNQKYEIRKELKKHSILFIGINPAGEGKLKENENAEKVLDIYTFKYYNLEGTKVIEEGTIAAKGKKSAEGFMQRFNEICTYCNKKNTGKEVGMSHLDMLFINDSNQKGMEKKIKKVTEKHEQFVREQADLAKLWIGLVEPVAIVFCNAMAQSLFLENIERVPDDSGDDPCENDKQKEEPEKKIYGRIKFDNELGTYVLDYDYSYSYTCEKINAGKKFNEQVKLHHVPVFFSRPLGGSGTCGDETYYRLKWQIKRALQLTGVIDK